VKTHTLKFSNNKRVISSVKASMEFEGLRPSVFAQKIGEYYLKDKISSHVTTNRIKVITPVN